MFKISKSRFSTLTERTVDQLKLVNERINQKIKGTFIEKWVTYWNHVARDYKEVAVQVQQDIKSKPLKSTLIFTGLGFLTYCTTHNPNGNSFRAKYVQCANDVSLVSENIVNSQAVNHLKFIEQCYNTNLIRYRSLGIFSIIWVDQFSSECDTYETNCSYLKIQYRRFADHIIDVGFLNIWWVISRKMLDYDINY